MTGLMGRPALRVPAAVLALAVVVRVLVAAFGPGPLPATSTIRLPRASATGKFATCVGKARNIAVMNNGEPIMGDRHVPDSVKIKRVTWTLDSHGLTTYFQMAGRIPKSAGRNYYTYSVSTDNDLSGFAASLGPKGWSLTVIPGDSGPDPAVVDIKPIINGNVVEVRLPRTVRLPSSGAEVDFGEATQVSAEVSFEKDGIGEAGDGCPSPYSQTKGFGGRMLPLGGK